VPAKPSVAGSSPAGGVFHKRMRDFNQFDEGSTGNTRTGGCRIDSTPFARTPQKSVCEGIGASCGSPTTALKGEVGWFTGTG
jgi:hypothetical protein